MYKSLDLALISYCTIYRKAVLHSIKSCIRLKNSFLSYIEYSGIVVYKKNLRHGYWLKLVFNITILKNKIKIPYKMRKYNNLILLFLLWIGQKSEKYASTYTLKNCKM